MEINVSKLDNVLNDYDMIIKKVAQNNSDIYGNFTELSKNWKDQRITNMMTKYNSEKSSYSQLEKNIKNQYYVYKFLQTKYSKLGNKIKCNLNNKDLIKEYPNKLFEINPELDDEIYDMIHVVDFEDSNLEFYHDMVNDESKCFLN